MKFTYLLLNLFTLLPVLVFSFDKKLCFFEKWKSSFPGILGIGLFFAIWDYFFTYNKVWSFNPAYVMDFRIFLMPLEEYFFFLFTPFACLFIYEAIGVYVKSKKLSHISKPLALFFAVLAMGIAISNTEKTYTFVNFSLCSLILIAAFCYLDEKILGQFWLAFTIHLIPFWVVNGVLTSWPVLTYDNSENLEIRIGSIPLEDHAYSLILFLSNLWAYEWFKSKFRKNGLES